VTAILGFDCFPYDLSIFSSRPKHFLFSLNNERPFLPLKSFKGERPVLGGGMFYVRLWVLLPLPFHLFAFLLRNVHFFKRRWPIVLLGSAFLLLLSLPPCACLVLSSSLAKFNPFLFLYLYYTVPPPSFVLSPLAVPPSLFSSFLSSYIHNM